MKNRQLLVVIGCWFMASFCYGGEAIVIGEIISIPSTTLTQPATLNIRLPDSYQTLKNKRYPILLSVGEDNSFAAVAGAVHWLSHNQEYPMPETIVVGLTTATAVRFIERGVKGEDFLQFFAKDVIPYLDKNYRTQPFRMLAASERFGSVPLYALSHQGALFQAYIAMSPWLDDETELLKQWPTWRNRDANLSAFLWLSTEEKPPTPAIYESIVALLKQSAPAGLVWQDRRFNSTTMGQSLISLPQALEALFADLSLPADAPVFAGGALAIKNYYQQLSTNKYGYAVSAQKSLDALGHSLLAAQNNDLAIGVFQDNVKQYPDSPHVYASLAAGLQAANNLVAALAAQKTAWHLAKQQNDPYGDYYQQLFNELEAALAAKGQSPAATGSQ